jgi:MOSC domain-containing protein YiiM
MTAPPEPSASTPIGLATVNVGAPSLLARTDGTDVWSGIAKHPVAPGTMLWLSTVNLAGDGQADLSVHGGVDKAVYAYPVEHYPPWMAELGLAELPYGGFGENLTVSGLLEPEVCIGDVYQAGTVRLQVSQPRGPCWKLARRWGIKDLALRFTQSGRTGFYLRVLQEGLLEAGMTLERVERPAPEWSVLRAHRLMQDVGADPMAAERLSDEPTLAASWRASFKRRLERLVD